MLSELRNKFTESGFDLCEDVHTRWYNDLIESEGHVERGTLSKLPEPPTICERVNQNDVHYNGILVGNTKHIWPKFIQWLSIKYYQQKKAADEEQQDEEEIWRQIVNDNPFDSFISEALTDALQSCGIVYRNTYGVTSCEIFWSNGKRSSIDLSNVPSNIDNDSSCTDHQTAGMKAKSEYHCYNENEATFLVSMQRTAKLTGKYWHDDKGTMLCVHPRFGTWTAFRAVMIFHTNNNTSDENDVDASQNIIIPNAPPPCRCPVSPDEIEVAKKVMKFALGGASNTKENSGKTYGCGPGGSSPLCEYLHNTVTSGNEWSKVSSTMRPWIQLRDCISIGRDLFKYEDDQLLYHYTKDPDILRRNLLEQGSICSSNNNTV